MLKCFRCDFGWNEVKCKKNVSFIALTLAWSMFKKPFLDPTNELPHVISNNVAF